MSDPSATASIPQASATAAPPEDPPALSAGSQALPVAPCTGLKVWLPRPNSGVLVLPMNSAPAARIRATIRSSLRATCPAMIGEPIEVGNPATFDRSFTAIGNPCSQPLRGA